MSEYARFKARYPERPERMEQPPERFRRNPDDMSEKERHRFSQRLQDDDDEQPLGARINKEQALKELVEDIEQYSPSQRELIQAGAFLAITKMMPWFAKRFVAALSTEPVATQTADAVAERLQFMGPPQTVWRE